MRLADQHMHCRCSFDAEGSLADMTAAAARAGFSLVCFTDHMDMASDKTGHTQDVWAARWEQFARRREEYERQPAAGLEVRFGMELGAPAQAEAAARQVNGVPLDFVIGSVHNLPDVQDFYWYRYTSETECESLNRRYLAELFRTAALDCFDVMGHVGYTSRYMARQGFHERVTVEKYGEELTALLRRLIERGKGIECNASGLRDGGGPFPGEDVLRLYRSLGGEILTVGGDSHRPQQIGGEIAAAYELLKKCGFRYITEFRNRQAEFVPLA